jgi:hypothetical protein
VGGGGSAPAGSGGSGFPQNTAGGAYAYTPQFQPQQDWMLNQLLSGQGGSVLGQAYTDQQPATRQYWQQAQPISQAGFNLVNGPMSSAGQIPGNVFNNPYYQQAQTGADTAAYNMLQAAYGGYGTDQSTILGNLNQALGQSQPGVLQAIQNVQQGGQNLGGYAGNVAGLAPGLPGLGQQTAGLTSALAAPFQGLGQQAGGISQAGVAPSQQLAGQAAGMSPLLQQIAALSGQLPGLGQQAAGITQGGLPATQQLAGQGAAMAPQFAQQLQQAYQPLGQAAGQILQTGFDPQSALYNRTAQQVLDQSRAVNAMSGVGTSPYGAGVTGQTMANFNIDWQNQQLQRQAQAAQSAGNLTNLLPGFQQQAMAGLTNAANLQAAPGALAGQALQQQISPIQAAGGLQNQALASLAAAQGAQAAPGALAGQAAQQQIAPNQAAAGLYDQALQQQLRGISGAAGLYGQAGGLTGQNIAANQAAAGLYSGLPQLANAYTGAYGTLGQQIAASAAQPGQAYLGQQNAQTAALQNYLSQLGQAGGLTQQAANVGQSQFNEPNALLQAMETYLGTGQNAAQLAGNLGQMGSQQSAQGLAGLTGLGVLGSNALFGSNSPFAAGGGTGGGLVGALGGFGGNVNPTGLTTIDPATGIQDFSGGTVPSSGALSWLQGLFGGGG